MRTCADSIDVKKPAVMRVLGLLRIASDCFLVPGGGLEPPHLAAADFESAASTDSATPAGKCAPLECCCAHCEARIIRQTGAGDNVF